MYIRRTRTNNTATGEAYLTYRLVRGESIAGKVRQITVLNLGRHFPIRQDDWPLLCSRIEQLLNPQNDLIPAPKCPDPIERAAQRVFAQLVERAIPAKAAVSPDAVDHASAGEATSPDPQEVDIGSLQLAQPRSVGVEQVALHAVSQLGLVEKLTELGIHGAMRAAILGNLIGRIAHPASERATWDWLQNQCGLGELLDVDFTGMSHAPVPCLGPADAASRTD